MPLVSLDCPEELLARIDALVVLRKAGGHDKALKVSEDQQKKAFSIAKEQGIYKANEYLRSVTTHKASRKSVMLELINTGMNVIALKAEKKVKRK